MAPKPVPPLSGVKILDLSRLLPGPWAASLLADYGAEVTKVEQPGRGDYSRWSTPTYRHKSVYFSTVNKNKRSVTANLASEDGRQIVARLAERSDIVIESFRPGVAERLGIGFRQLSELNPRLIFCSVTGFGQDGPYSGFAGHDLNIAGLAGFLNVDPDREPQVSGLQMADFAAASMTTIAVLMALRQRDIEGVGQHLDVSMFDSLVSWMPIAGASALARLAGYSGEPPLQAFGGNPRYQIYRTRDGRHVSVSLLERSFWEKLCRTVGRDDLINAAETDSDRLTDHGQLKGKYEDFLRNLFLVRDRDDWVSLLQANDVPCCPIYTPDEVLQDPHVVQRGMVTWIDDPQEGRIAQLSSPVKGSRLQPGIFAPAPACGEHNERVLSELGYDADEIQAFRDQKIV